MTRPSHVQSSFIPPKSRIALNAASIQGCLNCEFPGLASGLPRSLVAVCLTDDLADFDTYEKC
jgi:hypothetical protein